MAMTRAPWPWEPRDDEPNDDEDQEPGPDELEDDEEDGLASKGFAPALTPPCDEAVFVVTSEGAAAMQEKPLVHELQSTLGRKVWISTDGPNWLGGRTRLLE